MIRSAAGEKLALRQDDIRIDGWAVEARLYAEDPRRGFLPSIGRLNRYRTPPAGRKGGVSVRIDAGVEEGSEISLWFDPLIAKLVTHGPDRATAVAAMSDVLDGVEIDGVAHNQPFLAALMEHPRWRDGRLSTGFIAEEFPHGFASISPSQETFSRLAAVALSIALARRQRLDAAASVGAGSAGRRPGIPLPDDPLPSFPFQGEGARWRRRDRLSALGLRERSNPRPLPLKGGGWEGVTPSVSQPPPIRAWRAVPGRPPPRAGIGWSASATTASR